jgi:hypothetical protein
MLIRLYQPLTCVSEHFLSSRIEIKAALKNVEERVDFPLPHSRLYGDGIHGARQVGALCASNRYSTVSGWQKHSASAGSSTFSVVISYCHKVHVLSNLARLPVSPPASCSSREVKKRRFTGTYRIGVGSPIGQRILMECLLDIDTMFVTTKIRIPTCG